MTGNTPEQSGELHGPPVAEIKEDTNRLVAFGGYVKERLYDPQQDLADIVLTDVEKSWFNAVKLEDILFTNDRNSRGLDPNPVGYAKGVLLPPKEFTWVRRPPELLARSAARKTIAAATDITDQAVERSDRSRIHALETTVDAISLHRDGLVARNLDVLVLLKEAKSPGFAHKPAHEMKRLIGQSWSELLNVIDTLRIYRNWDDETRRRVEASAINYLTSQRQNTRVGKWQSLLDLQARYLDARAGLLGQAARAHQREIQKTQNRQTYTVN